MVLFISKFQAKTEFEQKTHTHLYSDSMQFAGYYAERNSNFLWNMQTFFFVHSNDMIHTMSEMWFDERNTLQVSMYQKPHIEIKYPKTRAAKTRCTPVCVCVFCSDWQNVPYLSVSVYEMYWLHESLDVYCRCTSTLKVLSSKIQVWSRVSSCSNWFIVFMLSHLYTFSVHTKHLFM